MTSTTTSKLFTVLFSDDLISDTYRGGCTVLSTGDTLTINEKQFHELILDGKSEISLSMNGGKYSINVLLTTDIIESIEIVTTTNDILKF